MEATLFRRPDERRDEEDEPPQPVDLLAECDSDETIAAVGQALQERHQVVFIESDEKAYARLKRQRPQLVFNIAERVVGPNRESHRPTVCEMLDIPYTGSNPLTLGVCLDESPGQGDLVRTTGSRTRASGSSRRRPAFQPASGSRPSSSLFTEGSSKGIKNNSLVRQPGRPLRARWTRITTTYKQPVIVERFLAGREFTVGVLGNTPNYEILPIVEIDHSQLPSGAAPIYSYEAKWVWDRPENPLDIFRCPAPVSPMLKAKIENVVTRTCAVLRIRDWCRVDVRLDEKGEPNILEVNPLPGILPKPEDNSCLPKAARTAGYSYSDLIHRVVEEASKRCGLRQTRIRPAASERPAVHADRA